jgi:glyoxylase I family protein
MIIERIHHIAIICSNYQLSKKFYTEILGLNILAEHFRAEKDSYKCDLAINNDYAIELFSFPNPPQRISNPETTGLRHLCFQVKDIMSTLKYFQDSGIQNLELRYDEFTGKNFFFIYDPDMQPIEFYSA